MLEEGKDRERLFLYGVLAVSMLISLLLLSSVIWTVFFAITLAYAFYPLHRKLVEKTGISELISSIIITLSSVISVILLSTPFLIVLYRRRNVLIDLLSNIPSEISFELFGTF